MANANNQRPKYTFATYKEFLIRCINSCETYEQVQVARDMVDNVFLERFRGFEPDDTITITRTELFVLCDEMEVKVGV